MFTGRETMIRLRATRTTDRYSGQPTVLDWTNPDKRRLRGCSVQRKDTSETLGRQDQVRTQYTVTVDRFPDVQPLDRVVWRGTTYDVTGDPDRLYDGIPHTVFVITKVVG